MVRIDEIYNNTFWPWLRNNRPGVRAFFCEPFGRSDPDSIMNYGSDDIHEHNYIFFFDQEPIHLNIHIETFNRAYGLNLDLTGELGNQTRNAGHSAFKPATTVDDTASTTASTAPESCKR